MGLDSRYRWTFPAVDPHGRDIAVGVGIQLGDGTNPDTVIVSTTGWFRMDESTAVDFSIAIQAAASEVMQRRQP